MRVLLLRNQHKGDLRGIHRNGMPVSLRLVAYSGWPETTPSLSYAKLVTNSEFSCNLAKYDEDIGGFQFSRAPTKKLKSAPASDNVATEEPVVHSPRRGRPPKSHAAQSAEDAMVDNVGASIKKTKATRGRPKRVSVELQAEVPGRQSRKRDEEPPFPIEKPAKKGRPAKANAPVDVNFRSPEPSQSATSKIALPVADTPVIRRNKEMREGRGGKGQRRNSLGMRGRRASSLIDSGASNGV